MDDLLVIALLTERADSEVNADWVDRLVTDAAQRSFEEVFGAAYAQAGDPATVGDGPFARWLVSDQWLTVHRTAQGVAIVFLESVDSVAEEERSSFEFLEIDDIPYLWRADVTRLLPNGTYLPGEHVLEDLDSFPDRLHAVCLSVFEAVTAMPILRKGFNLTITDATSRNHTQWSVIAEEGREGTSALIRYPDAMRDGRWVRVMDWEERPLTPDGVRASVDAVLQQISGWGVSDPDQITQSSCFTTRKRVETVWVSILMGLGIARG